MRASRPAETARPEFRAGRAVGWLTGFAAFGVGLSALYAVSGRGIGCVLYSLTGWECPFCGGTRLGSALLHGDVAAAFWFNPLVFIGLVVLTVVGGLWAVEAAGGPGVRPSRVLVARLRRITPTGWLLLGGSVALVYTVLRNLT